MIDYPLFIIAKDDLSMEMIKDPKQLSVEFEKYDIQDGLYSGWDVKGVPIVLAWDRGVKLIVKDETPQLDGLKNSILEYAKNYRQDAVFVYNVNSDDIVVLFEAVERFISGNGK